MAKSKPSTKTTTERVKELPWAAMLSAAVVVGERWRQLSEKDRARLTELLRESRGRLANLTDKERRELRRLAGKLDVKGMSRDLVLIVRGARRVRGSRRRSG